MKNLFIMHTQYNLILSAAVLSKLPNSHNTLVLYSEFKVGGDIEETLSRVFDRVIFVRKEYRSILGVYKESKQTKAELLKTKEIWNEQFDCVYLSQERLFDMCLLKKIKRHNPSIKCYSVEEDVYYSVNNRYNAPNYVHKTGLKKKAYGLISKALMLPYSCSYLEDIYCYAMNSVVDGVHLLFPDLARREIASKELIEISNQQLLDGINSIYGDKKTEYPQAESYAIMFFDLMSRYKNKELVSQISLQFIKQCEEKGIQVLMKYHPRETEKFDIKGVCEIDQLIPGEKVLADLHGKNAIVFGNATTSCTVAAKLGYKVISIAKIERPENETLHTALEKMNIKCINNITDLKEI